MTSIEFEINCFYIVIIIMLLLLHLCKWNIPSAINPVESNESFVDYTRSFYITRTRSKRHHTFEAPHLMCSRGPSSPEDP